MELARSIEIIFNQLRFGLRLVVLVKRVVIFQRLSTVVQPPNIIGINNCLPLAIQTGGLTRVDIGDQRRNLLRTSRREEGQTQGKCQTTKEISHEWVFIQQNTASGIELRIDSESGTQKPQKLNFPPN